MLRARAATLATAAAAVVAASALPIHPAVAAENWTAAPAAGALACTAQHVPLQAGHDVRLTTSLGATTVTLTGVSGHSYLGVPRLRDGVLTLRHAGRKPWQATPRPAAGTPGRGVLVAPVHGSGSSSLGQLCLVRFDSGQAPVAVLATTSAFNQCCYVVRTYAPGVSPSTPLQDGTAPTSVRVVGGHPLIVTGDGRFLAAFADYADSGFPLRLLTVRDGRQTDVTRQHQARLRSDAHRWLRLFDSHDFGLGFLACWAADQELLGHDAKVWSTLDTLDSQHRLTVPKGLGSYWPHGTAYIKVLRSYLVKTGYLPQP